MSRHFRNLSGIYYLERDPDTGQNEPVCFEELSESRKIEIIQKSEDAWKQHMILKLCEVINCMSTEVRVSVQSEE